MPRGLRFGGGPGRIFAVARDKRADGRGDPRLAAKGLLFTYPASTWRLRGRATLRTPSSGSARRGVGLPSAQRAFRLVGVGQHGVQAAVGRVEPRDPLILDPRQAEDERLEVLVRQLAVPVVAASRGRPARLTQRDPRLLQTPAPRRTLAEAFVHDRYVDRAVPRTGWDMRTPASEVLTTSNLLVDFALKPCAMTLCELVLVTTSLPRGSLDRRRPLTRG